MSIQYFVGNKLVGLSSDSKPTTLIDGATFYEIDTGNSYVLSSSIWIPIGMARDGSVNPVNITFNGSFEDWSNGPTDPPDYWFFYTNKASGAVARDGGVFRFGSYSTKLTLGEDGDCLIAINYETDIAYWQGRKMTFGCWVWCDVADSAVLGIYDQVSGSESSRHTGSGTWEWLSFTYTVNVAATRLDFYCNIYKTGSAYFDGAMIVEGGSQFAFSERPMYQADIDTAVGNKVLGDGSVNPTNLVLNGDFENWSAGTSVAPDSWSLFANDPPGSVAKNISVVKIGTSSVAVTSAGVHTALGQGISAEKGTAYWQGRTLTFSCWVWCNAPGVAGLMLNDDTTDFWSTKHTGDSTWQLLTVTGAMGPAATGVQVQLAVGEGAIAYFDGAMLVEGASTFAFADKPASEATVVDYFATSTIVGWAASPTGNIYIKKIGDIVFVNYYITGTSNAATTSFTVPYTISGNAYNGSLNTTAGGGIGICIAGNGTSIISFPGPAWGDTTWADTGTKIVQGQIFFKVV